MMTFRVTSDRRPGYGKVHSILHIWQVGQRPQETPTSGLPSLHHFNARKRRINTYTHPQAKFSFRLSTPQFLTPHLLTPHLFTPRAEEFTLQSVQNTAHTALLLRIILQQPVFGFLTDRHHYEAEDQVDRGVKVRTACSLLRLSTE